jgi:monoamine oxidase
LSYTPYPDVEYLRQNHDSFNRDAVRALFKHPGDLAPFDRRRQRKHVCVVGGGIAGLTAAYELARLRHRVTLLEASDRYGGRLYTKQFPDEVHGEFGAMRIPAIHDCTLHYINEEFPELSATLRPFVGTNVSAQICLARHIEKLSAWTPPEGEDSAWLPNFPFLTNRNIRPQIQRERPDKYLGGTFIANARKTLETRDLWELFEGNFSEDIAPRRLRAVGSVSLAQYAKGMLDAMLGGVGTPPTLSQDEWNYLGLATGELWFEQASLLDVILNSLSLLEPDKFELRDGMEALVNAFVAKLKSRPEAEVSLQKNSEVVRLKILDGGVEVTWKQGNQTVVSSDVNPEDPFHYVICTVPASATARIRFIPTDLSPRKHEALTNISYCSSGKALVYCKRRSWELDDHIFGGGSYTDLPIQQIWYPSDNAVPNPDADVPMAGSLGGEQSEQWVGKPMRDRKEAGVITAAYLWGKNNRRFAALSESEREDVVRENLTFLHPKIQIEEVKTYIWDEQRGLGRGAFALFGPGEYERYLRALWEPHPPGDAPKVFFAGEHISLTHAWIQGAIQSALGAVQAILEAP